MEEVKQTAQAYAMSFSSPEHEKEKVYALYEKLIEARTETGERSTTPSLKDFEKFVQQKTKDLKTSTQRSCPRFMSRRANHAATSLFGGSVSSSRV